LATLIASGACVELSRS